jgi:uncharacterized protein YjdB
MPPTGVRAGMLRRCLVAALVFVTACESDTTLPPNFGPGIILTPPSARIAVGDSVRFSATVAIPEEADKRTRWTSSDEQVVAVDGLGLVRAKSAGTATVTVASVAEPSTRASAIVIVTAVP